MVDTEQLQISKVIRLDDCFASEHMDITNNGNIIVIACESSPTKKTTNGYTVSIPKGVVKIVDVTDVNNIKQFNLDFDAFNWMFEDDYKFGYDVQGRMHSSIYRQFKSVPFSIVYCNIYIDICNITNISNKNTIHINKNAEPEYITISDDDRYAFVSLQDCNAMAVVELNNNNIEGSRIINVYGLGIHSINSYDHGVNSYGMDISDKDGINIKKHPNLYALKQPDAIKYFEQNGKHYILTANEGTEKNFDESRIVNLKLNATHFDGYDVTKLKQLNKMGRLQVSNLVGYQMNGLNKVYNTLYTFGSRNFDIFEWDPVADTLTSVYNSRDDFETITASILGKKGFNSHNRRSPSFDQASDNQGPEPESIQYYKCNNNNQFAFIGLEKTSGIFTYNVNNVNDVEFIQYTSNRNYSIPYSSKDRPSKEAGDIEPSDMKIIDAKHFGQPLLMVSNEDSSSLTIYTINCGDNNNLNNNDNNENNAELSDAMSKKNPFKIAPSSKWYIDLTIIIGVTLLFGILTFVCCKCCSKIKTHERIPDNKNEQMLVQVM